MVGVQQILADNALFWSIEDAIDPDALTAPLVSVPIEAKLDQFLARPVMLMRGERFSTRDLIKLVAHTEGGVHAGRPTNAREKLLGQVSRLVPVQNIPSTVRTVQRIGKAAGLLGLEHQTVAGPAPAEAPIRRAPAGRVRARMPCAPCAR